MKMNCLLILLILLKLAMSSSQKLDRVFLSTGASAKCSEDLKLLSEADRVEELSRMWSNFSKEHFYGNSHDFGDFYGCLDFKHDLIKSQHCLIQYEYRATASHKMTEVLPSKMLYNTFWENLHKTFGGAVCVPDSCTVEDIRRLMSDIFDGSDYVQVTDYDQNMFCQKSDGNFKMDLLQIILLLISVLLIGLTLAGTALTSSEYTSKTVKVLQCFSLKANFDVLFDTTTSESTITCINGLKTIAILGVITAHSLFSKLLFPFKSGKDMLASRHGIEYFLAFSLTIDTLFVISGVLIGRLLLRAKVFNFWTFCFKRYVKSTTSALVMAYFAVSVFSLAAMKPHPLGYFLDSIVDNCRNTWWKLALNIQNFADPSKMCVPQSWQLSTLFQLTVVSAFIHALSRKMPKSSAFVCCVMATLASLAVYSFISLTNGTFLDFSEKFYLAFTEENYKNHTSPYFKAFPFFSGVLLAHILERYFEKNPKSSKTNGFVIILGLYLSITFLFLLPLVVGNGRILITIYGIMWSVAMNFIIFACHTGHGGAINSFLSSKFWTAISKMILSIYLTATAIHGKFSIKSAPTSSTITASEFILGSVVDIVIVIPPSLWMNSVIEGITTNLPTLLNKKKVQ